MSELISREAALEEITGLYKKLNDDNNSILKRCYNEGVDDALDKIEHLPGISQTEQSNVADTNVGNTLDQTAKSDAGKLQLTLVPTQIIRDIAEVREYGVKKYADSENWKRVELERYRDALYRHLLEYLDDHNGVDEESGIPHYKHIACNMAFICELEQQIRNR